MRNAISGLLLLALALPASAQTVVVQRPPVRVVRVIPAPPREIIVQAPLPPPVYREAPLIGIRPGCLSVLGFPLICARI